MRKIRVYTVEKAIKEIKEARVSLTLNLTLNHIGDAGAKFLSEGVKEALFPLTLNLSSNRIGEVGAKFLAEGIKEARVPLTLHLCNNNIGDAGAQFLADGMKEALVPLTLNLRENNVGDAGAQFLADGIKEARVPITLDLSFNKIRTAGAQFLAEGIKEARVPIILGLKANGMLAAGAKLLTDAQENNFVIDAGANPSEFLKRIEFSQSKRMLEETLCCPSVLAKLVQDYMGDDKAIAWLEVAAIRAVEGASRDNKYASINYDLLTAVYSTAPVAAVASALEEKEDDGQESRIEAPVVISAGQNREIADGFKGQGTLYYTSNSYPEYYNSGIDQVLELRLAGITNAVVLKSQYFGEEFGNAVTRLVYDVSSILSGGTVQTVLAPVNLYNKHWLGLSFRNLGAMVDVTYMDSEQRAMLPQIKEELEHVFAMNSYQSHFVTAKLALQSYNNCGFELIENFAHYLTGTRATQKGALYLQSLLAENSLLDPEIYVLKLEENNNLIRFLSNAEPIAINEITTFVEQGSENKHERAMPDNSIAKLKTDLHRGSILFKTLDFVVDSGRFSQEPTVQLLKKLALNYAQLQAMVSGVNRYSVIIAGAETLYQLQLGEYQKAFNVASSTISAMALSVILAMANRPYLGLAYGALMAASTAYGAITNAYSFVLELSDEDATLKSTMAYKDLAEWMTASPLQILHDFGAKVKEYKLQINDLLFEKEKAIVQVQVKDEFGQKVFDYIYLPELIEKYVLLSDAIRGELTEEEAVLKSKPVTIRYGALEYNYCVRTEDSRDEAAAQYYCCNVAGQILYNVILTGSGSLEILEML